MRWKQKSSELPLIFDFFNSKEIVYDAYREGYINWNVYQKTKEKITSNMNGSWMFGRGSEQIDFSKVYRD
jgi:hypothetical protein